MVARRLESHRTLLVAALLAASSGLCAVLWLASSDRPHPARAVPAGKSPRRESPPTLLEPPLAVAPEPPEPAPEIAESPAASVSAEPQAGSATHSPEPPPQEPVASPPDLPGTTTRATKVVRDKRAAKADNRRERKRRGGG